MPVTSTIRTGDGSESDFTYTFDVIANFNTVQVGLKTVDEPDYTLQVENTHYLHIPATKTISFLSDSVPANGVQILITRATTRKRTPAKYKDGSTLTPDILNNNANRLATVDEEVEDRVVQVRTTEPTAAQMPTVGTPKTLDMGIAADLLILQGIIDGTHSITYTVVVPAEGETVRMAGTQGGNGSIVGPDLSFVLDTDPTLIDVTMNAANGHTGWTQVKLVAMQFPVVANL